MKNLLKCFLWGAVASILFQLSRANAPLYGIYPTTLQILGTFAAILSFEGYRSPGKGSRDPKLKPEAGDVIPVRYKEDDSGATETVIAVSPAYVVFKSERGKDGVTSLHAVTHKEWVARWKSWQPGITP